VTPCCGEAFSKRGRSTRKRQKGMGPLGAFKRGGLRFEAYRKWSVHESPDVDSLAGPLFGGHC